MNISQLNTWRCYQACEKEERDQWAQFFDNPRKFIKKHRVRYIKNKPNDPTTIVLIKVGEKHYIAKRYNIKNYRHAIKILLRGTHAVKTWRNAWYLYQQGIIPVAKPVAVYEKRWGPFRGRGYFICEYMPKARKASELIREHPETTLKGLVQLTSKLFSARVQHNDFQLENILFVEGVPYLVDFDHLRFYHHADKKFLRAHAKDIERMKKCFTPEHLHRFCKLLT